MTDIRSMNAQATDLQQFWHNQMTQEAPALGEFLKWLRWYTQEQVEYGINITASAALNKFRNGELFTDYSALKYCNSVLHRTFPRVNPTEGL